MKMPSVEAAAQHSIKLVAAAAIGVVFGNLVFRAVDKIAGGALAKHADSINLPAAAIESALKPANVRGSVPSRGVAEAAASAAGLYCAAAATVCEPLPGAPGPCQRAAEHSTLHPPYAPSHHPPFSLCPQALLPFYGLAYSATVASSLAQVAARKMSSEFSTLCCEFGRGGTRDGVHALPRQSMKQRTGMGLPAVWERCAAPSHRSLEPSAVLG